MTQTMASCLDDLSVLSLSPKLNPLMIPRIMEDNMDMGTSTGKVMGMEIHNFHQVHNMDL